MELYCHYYYSPNTCVHTRDVRIVTTYCRSAIIIDSLRNALSAEQPTNVYKKAKHSMNN